MTKYKTPKINELFEAGVHIGHQAKRWHPKMEKYIYSTENKVHVFDLEQTEDLLKKACEFLYETAKKGGQIIFVGTKRQAGIPIKSTAIDCGALYVSERWIGGTLTNYKMIKKNIDKLVNYKKDRAEGAFQKYTKKERLLLDREIEKLERNVGGIVNLKGTPQAMVVIDPRKEKTSVREANRAKVPVVALIDTNTDPTAIDYVVPGNDDAIKSISMIIGAFGAAVKQGYLDFDKDKEKAVREAEEEKKAAEEAKKGQEAAEKERTPLTVKVSADNEDEDADVSPEDLSTDGVDSMSDADKASASESEAKK